LTKLRREKPVGWEELGSLCMTVPFLLRDGR
jgi:hypothetical protein